MNINKVSNQVSISPQLSLEDVYLLSEMGVGIIVCNRPDNEEANQVAFSVIAEAAKKLDIEAQYIPFTAGTMAEADVNRFANLLTTEKRIHAYCRTGNRSEKIWQAASTLLPSQNARSLAEDHLRESHLQNQSTFDVVIIGAGSGGIATASSLLQRNHALRIGLIDPSSNHYYQPGWSLVGGGEFSASETRRDTAALIPDGCEWIKQAVIHIDGEKNTVHLDNQASVYYNHLVVSPGLVVDWSAIEGLEETLGKNGVTSNYRYDLAPYTWELVSNMKQGKAIFTQPTMPIKCAGAPQKAMYLSASEWLRKGTLKNITIQFYNAGAVLFGVADYVPALMKYIKKYNVELCFTQHLIKIDGLKKTAWFKNGEGDITETLFDFIHVCPPQTAPSFIKTSGLADEAGWLDVDSASLQSKKYNNIWGMGDVMNTTNAKTMAAARKQAPVVAHNIVNAMVNNASRACYEGYGSCPLMVEHGKVVLAEFSYGGKVTPSFPNWLNDGTKPTFFGWFLKKTVLPYVYWYGMLKGREWLAKPKMFK
jgi:sulfide:quinone oxidoreductase